MIEIIIRSVNENLPEGNEKRNLGFSTLNSGSCNMLESRIRVAEFSRGWIPFAERVDERYDVRETQGRRGRLCAAEKRAGHRS